MSENKRFIIPEYPACILDTVEDKEYKMSSYYTHILCICDLLNNLSDENECLREIMGFMPNDNANDILNVLNYQESDKRKFQKENEQLKKDRFICFDCEHSGYIEIGCLCEYTDHWQEYITECEDFKELKE